MATEFTQINEWLKKLDSNGTQLFRRMMEAEERLRLIDFRDEKTAKELKDKLNIIERNVVELDDKIHNLKQVLKKFVTISDEQSQADFDTEVDSA